MSTPTQFKALFNDCALGANYTAGSLPTIDNVKLLRLASYLTKLDPGTFGTDPAAVTTDMAVVFLYKGLRDQIINIERSDTRQAVLDAVPDPDEY